MPSSRPSSTLASVFPSIAMARLVVFFAVHPGERFHLRELRRRTRLSSASLQHELRRLVGIGALQRHDEGGRAVYEAVESHPSWHAWMLLLRSSVAPADVLREALIDVALDGAFVFGSAVAGNAAPGSDVDVLMIASEASGHEAAKRLGDAEILIDRPLDVTIYRPEEFAARVRRGSGFARRIIDSPKVWLHGGPDLPGTREAA